MMKPKYRPIVTWILLAVIAAAATMVTPVPVYAQFSSTTPPQINGIFNPDTIYPSQISRLTINVFNPNTSQLTDVNWLDTLPTDLVVVNPANPVVSGCGPSYTLDAAPGTSVISISGATVDSTTDPVNPGVCSVTVSVTAFTVGNHTNKIKKTDGSVMLDGVLTNYEYDANITLLVLPMSAPSVTKEFTPDEVNEGTPSTLTINFTNNDSTVALTQAALTDTLPAGMSVLSTSSIALSGCGSGTLNPIIAGATVLNLTGATIAPGGTCSISLDVTVTGTGPYVNTIHPSDVTTYQKVTIPGNATDTLIVRNIVITKNFGLTNFEAGGSSSLTITLANPSTVTTLNGVGFIDTMPSGLSVVNTPGTISGTSCSGTLDVSDPTRLVLTGGTIPPGGTCTYTASVTASAAGSYSNSLACSDLTFAIGTPGCASASDSVTVYPPGFGLGVVKQFSDHDIEPGTSTRMTIAITAPGDHDISGLSMTDSLIDLSHSGPDVFVYSTPNIQNTCGGTVTATAGTDFVKLTGGSITRGNSCTIRVNVTSSVYGPHTNTIHPADVSNTEGQHITADVKATFTVRDISVAKDFASSIVGKNGVTSLTITLTNNYTNPLTDITFSDTLPGTTSDGIVIATPSNLANTCNGTVTAAPGTQLISLVGGSITTANGTCTVTLDVQGVSSATPPPGTTYTNTIAIGDVTGKVNGTTDTHNWHTTSDSLTVGSPDFRINKKFDPILVTGDTASTMTITLVNTESSPVSNITFTDTLPPHMLLADPANPSVGTCGGTITPAADRKSFFFTGGALAGKTECKLTIRAMMEVTGNLINTIPAFAVTTTQGMSNHQPTSATLTNLSSVRVVKKFSPNPVSPGSTSTLTLDITKVGIGIGLTGLGMSDSLTGLTIAPTPNATNTCGGTLSAPAGGPLIELTGGALPIGTGACRVTVDVLVPDTGLVAAGYDNCIPIGNIKTDQKYTNVMETCDNLGTLFDPPTGYKVFDASGLPQLEWRMVWINNHNSANINAQISDPIPSGTTYVAGSLTCVVSGHISSTTSCVEPTLTDLNVRWSGVIGPDRGHTTEATADNEVVITFRVNVPDTVHLVNNTGASTTDRNNNGLFTDETTASNANSNLSSWYRFGPGGTGKSDSDVEAKLLPASGFAPGKKTALPDIPAGIYDNGLQSMILDIPSLDVQSEIVGINSIDGKWDVTWLGNRLGYLEESSFPTWNGNSVITGHVFDAQGQPGPFNKLHTLKYGDHVTISSFGQIYTYEVRDVVEVAPDDIKAAFQHRDNSWITLVTCKGYDNETNSYRTRLLVRAVLIETH
jgi:LPXTG-site transpeptidase (sortase) family protein